MHRVVRVLRCGGRRWKIWVVDASSTETWHKKVTNRLKGDLTKPVGVRRQEKVESDPKWPWDDKVMATHVAKIMRDEVVGWGVKKPHAQVSETLGELKRMEAMGCEIGVHTFTSLVKHAFSMRDFSSMQVLWEDIVRRKLPVPVSIWSKILHSQAMLKSPQGVRRVWETYLQTGSNEGALLSSYIDALNGSGDREEAWKVFKSVKAPSEGICHSGIRCCASYQQAKEIIGEMEKTVGTTLQTYTKLIELLAWLKDVTMAQNVFDKVARVVQPDDMCWDALFCAYEAAADLEGLLKAVEQCKARHKTTTSRTPLYIIRTCTALLPTGDQSYLCALVETTFKQHFYTCKRRDKHHLIGLTNRFYHKYDPAKAVAFKQRISAELNRFDVNLNTRRQA